MPRTLQATARRCSAGERCASYAALGGPAKLSRANPGTACYACEERRAASELGKEAARRKPQAEGRGAARRRRGQPEEGRRWARRWGLG